MTIDWGTLQQWALDILPALLDAAVKGVVLLLIAGAIVAIMRKASAAARQMVWMLALVAMLVLPLASVVLPGWQVLPGWAKIDVPATLPTPRDEISSANVYVEQPMQSDEANALADSGGSPAEVAPMAAVTPEPTPQNPLPPTDLAVTSETPSPEKSWREWVAPSAVALWLAGTGICLLPLVLGRISLARLSRRSRRIEDGAWGTLLQRAAHAIGLSRRVQLLQSEVESMPMVWGIFRPKLLLPAEAENWSADRRWVVLLHELAHVKRCDCLAKFIAHLACAAYWFNPLAWIAFHMMQREAEAACDDLVLTAGHRPSDYATHLLEIASGLQSGLLAGYSSIAMARKSKLEGRLLAILDGRRNRRALTRAGVLLTAVVVLGVSLLIGAAETVSNDKYAAQPDPIVVDSPLSAISPSPIILPASPATQPATMKAMSLTATLPNGVKVELIGVSTHPSQESSWWRPDGLPLDKTPYTKKLSHATPDSNEKAYEFAVKLTGQPKEGMDLVSYDLEQGRTFGSSQPYAEEGGTMADLHAITAFLPENMGEADLKIGVVNGPWTTRYPLSKESKPQDGRKIHVTLSSPIEQDGHVVITAEYYGLNWDQQVRVVAVDTQGKIHTSSVKGGGVIASVKRLTVSFDLPKDQIKEFLFQSRPYEWAEFRKVSLRPRLKSEVQIVTGSEAVPSLGGPPPTKGMLEFRMAAGRPDAETMQDYQQMLNKGLVGEWWLRGKNWENNTKTGTILGMTFWYTGSLPGCIWLPLHENDAQKYRASVVGEYQGQWYMLVSNRADEVLAAPLGARPKWGLANVYKQTSPAGRLAIGFQFDEAGGKLFEALTSSHIGRTMAIIVDGEIMSAPMIRAAMRERGSMEGYFTGRDVDEMISALKAGMPSTSPPAEVFGPVIERTLKQADVNIENCLIDLDSGNLLTPPAELFRGTHNQASIQWFREHGVDCVGSVQKVSPGLAGSDLIALPMPNSMWESAKAETLLEAVSLATPGNPVYLVAKELPSTFVIKTREGSVGLLQILNVTTEPEAATTIRYKLLNGITPKPPWVSPTTQPASQPATPTTQPASRPVTVAG